MTEAQFGESFSTNAACGECAECILPKPCQQYPDKLTKARALCKPILDTAGKKEVLFLFIIFFL